jgi:hypothetical protein
VGRAAQAKKIAILSKLPKTNNAMIIGSAKEQGQGKDKSWDEKLAIPEHVSDA